MRPLLPHQKEQPWRSPSPKNDEFAIPGLGDLDMEEEDKFLYGEKVDVPPRRDSKSERTPPVTPTEKKREPPKGYPDRAKLEAVLLSVGVVGLDPNDVMRGPGKVEEELIKRLPEELVKKVMARQREWLVVPPEPASAAPVPPGPGPHPPAPAAAAPPYPGYPPHPQYPPQPGYPYSSAPPQGYPGYHYGYYPPAGYPPHPPPHDPAAAPGSAVPPPPIHPGQYYPPQPYPPQMNYGYPPVHAGAEHQPWPAPLQPPPQAQPALVAPQVPSAGSLDMAQRANLKVIQLQAETSAEKKPAVAEKKSLPGSEEAKIPQNPEEWKKMRAVQEQYKRKLELLQEEQERLRKQQGELMRKKQRQKDGHNDPLLVANSKLQEEMARQVETIRGSLINLTRALKATLHLCAPPGRDPRAKAQYPTQYPATKPQTPGVAPVTAVPAPSAAPPPVKREFEGPMPPAPSTGMQASSKGQWQSMGTPPVMAEDRNRDRMRPVAKDSRVDLTPPLKDPRVSRVTPIGKPESLRTSGLPSAPQEPVEEVEYIDGGNHWCKYCHDIFPMLGDLLKHLHSKHSPSQLFVSRDPPWSASGSKQAPPAKAGSAVKHVPLKGVEFIIPSTAYFCNLCKEFMGDTTCACTHLRGKKHNDNATKYASQHPNYDKRLSTVGALAKKEEMKRRQDEEEQEMAKRRKITDVHQAPKMNRDRVKERYESPQQRSRGDKDRSRYGELDREGFGDDGRMGSSSQRKDIKLNLVSKRSGGHDDEYYDRKYRGGGDRYDRSYKSGRQGYGRGSKYRDSSSSSRSDSDSDSHSKTYEDEDAPKPKIAIKMKGKMGVSAFQKQAAAAQKKPPLLTTEQQRKQRILSTVLKKMKKSKDDVGGKTETPAGGQLAGGGGAGEVKGTDFEALPMDIDQSPENGVVAGGVEGEETYVEPIGPSFQTERTVSRPAYGSGRRAVHHDTDEESDSEPAVPGEENVRIGEIPLPNRMVPPVVVPRPIPPPTPAPVVSTAAPAPVQGPVAEKQVDSVVPQVVLPPSNLVEPSQALTGNVAAATVTQQTEKPVVLEEIPTPIAVINPAPASIEITSQPPAEEVKAGPEPDGASVPVEPVVEAEMPEEQNVAEPVVEVPVPVVAVVEKIEEEQKQLETVEQEVPIPVADVVENVIEQNEVEVPAADAHFEKVEEQMEVEAATEAPVVCAVVEAENVEARPDEEVEIGSVAEPVNEVPVVCADENVEVAVADVADTVDEQVEVEVAGVHQEQICSEECGKDEVLGVTDAVSVATAEENAECDDAMANFDDILEVEVEMTASGDELKGD